jgi:uncharacterized protein YqhQ
MIEMMSVGMKAMNFSADVALGDEASDEPTRWYHALVMPIAILFGIALAIALFKFVPFGGTALLQRFFPGIGQGFFFNVIEGLIKIAIFLAYIALIGFLPDIRRVFEYHGAEHKVVRCHEEKKKLTVKNVATCSRLHPRCGTSFIIFILLLSIVVYTFIPGTLGFWEKFIWRIALLPVIAGISYEILRFSAKSDRSLLFRIISAPGLWTQRITTKEPDAKEIAVAIKALKVSM